MHKTRNSKGIYDNVVINPAEIRNLKSISSIYSFLDYLWMSGSWLAPSKNPNWSGYMELATQANWCQYMELATQAKRYISSTLTMADCCVLTRSKRLLSNSVQKLNFKDDIKQIDCINLIYDGKRFKWTSSWERLKNFVEDTLGLNGRWVSSGGNARKFICSNLDLSVTWYPG